MMEEENGAHFFEGTEKLLEVWFARQQPSPQEPHQSKGSGDLRTIPSISSSLGRGGETAAALDGDVRERRRGGGSSRSRSDCDGLNRKLSEPYEELLVLDTEEKPPPVAVCVRAMPEALSRFEWDKLLENVHCLIISVTKTDKQEAYVLSESSMFVSKRRFILKTCGTTLLLQALVPLLELAREYCGFDSIQSFFYSRKNFMKPSHQEYPHRNFQEEVEFLNEIFPSKLVSLTD
ncbi:UNVERIFIED_CONTAM: hypothetical protein K2H54_069694 [Gekko kuhli]